MGLVLQYRLVATCCGVLRIAAVGLTSYSSIWKVGKDDGENNTWIGGGGVPLNTYAPKGKAGGSSLLYISIAYYTPKGKGSR